LKDFAESDAETLSVLNRVESQELTDDRLDALTGWVLGKLWSKNAGKVRLLGDAANGTFLLPFDEDLEESYRAFFGN